MAGWRGRQHMRIVLCGLHPAAMPACTPAGLHCTLSLHSVMQAANRRMHPSCLFVSCCPADSPASPCDPGHPILLLAHAHPALPQASALRALLKGDTLQVEAINMQVRQLAVAAVCRSMGRCAGMPCQCHRHLHTSDCLAHRALPALLLPAGIRPGERGGGTGPNLHGVPQIRESVGSAAGG